MNNDIIIGYGIVKLCELINQKNTNLSDTIDILNNSLKKLDPNSAKYVEKLNVITDLIIKLKQNKTIDDREVLNNTIFVIQQLFDLNTLLVGNGKRVE